MIPFSVIISFLPGLMENHALQIFVHNEGSSGEKEKFVNAQNLSYFKLRYSYLKM